MSEQPQAIFISIPPQEVLMRLSQVIAGQREALLHPFATKARYMGTIYNNGFYMLPKDGFRRNSTRCTGVVDSNGSSSRISLSFSGSSSGPALIIGIAVATSVIAVAITSLSVFLAGKPVYILAIAIVSSLLFIGIMTGIGLIVRAIVRSKQQAMINFLDGIFRDVRIAPVI